MNIFYLDEDPKIAAEFLDDKRVVKMITETAQLLSNAVRHNKIDDGYRLTHENHPCTLWVRSNRENFEWLLEYEYHLFNQYKVRYLKQQHAGAEVGLNLSKYVYNIPKRNFYDPPQVMPVQYHSENTVIAYRNYFCGEKLPADWTEIEVPYWINPKSVTITTEYK